MAKDDDRIESEAEEENDAIDDLADDLSGENSSPSGKKPPSRSWSYDIWDLRMNGEPAVLRSSELDDQYRRTQKYKEELTVLEIERRESFRKIRGQHSPEIGEIDAKIPILDEKLEEERKKGKKVRQKNRVRTEFTPEVKLAIQLIKAEIKELREKKTELKKAIDVEYLAILSVYCPEILRIEAAIDILKKEAKALKEKENVGEVKNRRRAINQNLKYLRARRISLFQALGEDAERITKWKIERDMDVVQKDITKRARDARIRIKPYWGNYLFVDATLKVMRNAKVDPVPPKKKGWDGSGRVGVVMRPSINCEKLFGQKSKLLQITPLKPEAFYLPKRCDRRRATLTEGRIRINSTPDEEPIWMTFKLYLSREIPPDSVIKSAWIVRERVGLEFRHRLQMSIGSKMFSSEKPGTGTCALDLGWRCRNGRPLRVAYLVDDRGHEEEICLDPAIQEKLDHVASLRSIRDKAFDELRAEVVSWLAGAPKCWLHDRFKKLDKWKNIRKFVAHAEVWGEERVAGDEAIFSKVVDFCKQDDHLYIWESNEREKALAARKDDWRVVSARLSTTYAKVRLEDLDLSKLAKLSEPEADKEALHETSRHNRFQAAPSEFRQVLVSACTARGTLVENLPCEYSTMRCHYCGTINVWDKGAHLEHTCVGCGKTWDQDKNTGVNLLYAINVKQGKKGKKPTCDYVPAPDYAKKEERTAEVGLYFDPVDRVKAGYVKIDGSRRDILITQDVLKILDQARQVHEIRREKFRAMKARIESERSKFRGTFLDDSLDFAMSSGPMKLCRFVARKWSENRQKGDEALFASVKSWMAEEGINRERELALRSDAAARRRGIYLKVVDELSGVVHVVFKAIGAGGIPRDLVTSPSQLRGVIEDFLRQKRIGFNTDRRRHYESVRARMKKAGEKVG